MVAKEATADSDGWQEKTIVGIRFEPNLPHEPLLEALKSAVLLADPETVASEKEMLAQTGILPYNVHLAEGSTADRLESCLQKRRMVSRPGLHIQNGQYQMFQDIAASIQACYDCEAGLEAEFAYGERPTAPVGFQQDKIPPHDFG